jgi:diadenosine tetraphosphate (Ap4A) HIT family hydrolase
MERMTEAELRPWRDDWAGRLAGTGCLLCDVIGIPDSDWARRFFTGRYADAYLPKAGSVPGYTVVMWNGRHVAEPTQLTHAEAAGYWQDLLRVGAAVEQVFEHAKMNYQMLGNTVPHLHAHIVPRPLLDPAPHRPLPWSYLDDGRQDEQAIAAAAGRLAAVLGQSG